MASTSETTSKASRRRQRATSSTIYSGATPSAVRYKNWKMYYIMSQPGSTGWLLPLVPFHMTLVQNVKRDPFEQSVGLDQKSAMALGGSIGAPMTAWQYDFNILPLGQQLWLTHLETFEKYPPLQAPESYNLSQVLDQVKKANTNPSDQSPGKSSDNRRRGRPTGRPHPQSHRETSS
jgi:hypothetical protein